MNGWGRFKILAGMAAITVVCLVGTASAQFYDDRYENFAGYSGGWTLGGFVNTTAGPGFLVPVSPGGMSVNPHGVGNYLIGAYYDVRPRGDDAQVMNLQLLNNNTNDRSLPRCSINAQRTDYNPIPFFQGTDGEECYNPTGGVVAKVRFRDAKRSCEIFDFTVALSCGEVWAGRIELRNNTPTIVSDYPIVSELPGLGLPPDGNGNIVTAPILADGEAFSTAACPDTITADDMKNGYFEVVGLSSIACEPDRVTADQTIPAANVGAGELSKTGNRWTWTNTGVNNTDFAPTHALSAVAFAVRPGAGVSFEYNATALTRYRQPAFEGGENPQFWFGNNNPTLNDCSIYDANGNPVLVDSEARCVSQANLALHKARLMGQFDAESITAGRTNLIVTLPTKYENCNGAAPGNPRVSNSQLPTVENPFQCGTVGEEIDCTIYDRLENFVNVAGGGVISPGNQTKCILPKESTIIGIRPSGGAGDEANIFLSPSTLPQCADPATCAGWVELALTGPPYAPNGFSRQIDLPFGVHALDGIFVGGYMGLPAIGLVEQQFTNGALAGAYGAIVEATYDDPVILAGGGS